MGFRGGGGNEKKNGTKGGGGATKKNGVKEGGVTSNNWLVGEIESGSTQKQMKKLNIILFYILRSKSAFYINNNSGNEAYLLEKQ